MTPKQKFIDCLERKPITGRVPHFELVFFLTMEAFGKVHPSHRSYHQWDQMSEHERQLHREDMAQLYIDTARRYEHSAIFLHPNPGSTEEVLRLLDIVRERSGDEFFLMVHGDATYGIPSGDHMEAFSYRMVDEPEKLKSEAASWVDGALKNAERYKAHGALDGFALCADYCLNTGPFMSPGQFNEFVFPFLRDLIAGQRKLGFYTIKHTDGNIMPIIDQLVDANPHALHSIDPQAGVDIAEVKRLYGGRVCLIGNINCGLIDTGTDDDYLASARYALRHGMPGYGYIFSTSNCIYTGMKLERYERILELWRKEGNY
ncbi:MAG TPA: uroporphyrinogen decarboxylase family protein [Planctomycetota bacterium]|nr:uroporphyrinogen decarboxylase family protein [Planctomycetota bacterium]